MNIAVGSDHAGFKLKDDVIDEIKKLGHTVSDFGCFSEEPVDFPDIAQAVCNSVLSEESFRGIIVCGTGAGASIASNKIPGIRAALCHDAYTSHQCVEHDNVNVMCIGAQIIGDKLAREFIGIFLNATFSTNEEFRRRVAKLEMMDRAKVDN